MLWVSVGGLNYLVPFLAEFRRQIGVLDRTLEHYLFVRDVFIKHRQHGLLRHPRIRISKLPDNASGSGPLGPKQNLFGFFKRLLGHSRVVFVIGLFQLAAGDKPFADGWLFVVQRKLGVYMLFDHFIRLTLAA